MTAAITIIGSPISPYVRKVLAILDIKGVPFRCIPQVPLRGDENFTRISPLRRIPVLVDGDFTLPDSSAIAQYLEDRFPTPSVFPTDINARARPRAGSRNMPTTIWAATWCSTCSSSRWCARRS